MRCTVLLALAAAIFAPATFALAPANAGNPQGRLQVKAMVSTVRTDGKIDKVYSDLVPLPGGTDSSSNHNVVPTVAVEYFATPNFSIETICCLTQHTVYGRGAVHGAELVNHALVLPATVTAKLHQDIGAGIKPYVGVGPTWFFFINEKPGADLRALGAERLTLSNKFGVALQAGVDIPVNARGLGISLDAKRYFVRPSLRVYDSNDTEILHSRHKLDPWVLSAGLAYRF